MGQSNLLMLPPHPCYLSVCSFRSPDKRGLIVNKGKVWQSCGRLQWTKPFGWLRFDKAGTIWGGIDHSVIGEERNLIVSRVGQGTFSERPNHLRHGSAIHVFKPLNTVKTVLQLLRYHKIEKHSPFYLISSTSWWQAFDVVIKEKKQLWITKTSQSAQMATTTLCKWYLRPHRAHVVPEMVR